MLLEGNVGSKIFESRFNYYFYHNLIIRFLQLACGLALVGVWCFGNRESYASMICACRHSGKGDLDIQL